MEEEGVRHVEPGAAQVSLRARWLHVDVGDVHN
jgi:hypothetical protein